MTIVGRSDALAPARELLDGVAGGPAALVYDGAAGIGKTTLWEAALDDAAARGFRVLATRPGESDAGVAFAGLVDLLEEVARPLLHVLPRPQRTALSAAILDADAPTQELALGTAVRNVLRQTALAAPVVVAIDDVQWLDAASARALEFALRRLDADPIAVVATSRHGRTPAVDPTRAVPHPRLRRWTVGRLTRDEVARLLRARLELELAPAALAILYDACDGNPMYALELGRSVQAGTTELTPGAPLALGRSLRDLVETRIGSLAPGVEDALLTIAALADPRAADIEPDALAAAEERDLLVLDGVRVRFSHPLLREAVYERASPPVRRARHRALADRVEDPVERAFHLALGTPAPAERVAAEVERGATAAARRGARDAAGKLLEHAARLTPDRNARAARLLAAVEHLRFARDLEHGERLLAAAEEEVEQGPVRALARFWRAALTDAFDERRRLLDEAFAEADDELRVRVLLAQREASAQVSFAEARDLAYRAVALAETTGRRDLIASATCVLIFSDMVVGEPVDHRRAQRALELVEELSRDGIYPEYDVHAAYGQVLTYAGDLAQARPLLEASVRRARDTGRLPYALAHLSYAELRAGNVPGALRSIDEYDREMIGHPGTHAFSAFLEAFIRSTMGDEERVGSLLSQAEAHFDATTSRLDRVGCQSIRGFVALSTDRFDDAVREYLVGIELMRELGWGEVGIHPTYQNCAEALVALGRVGEAEALIDELEALARPLGRVCALAGALRARALVAAANADYASAEALCRDSLGLQATLPEPFELAQTRLVLGTVLRRAGRKAAARVELEQARVEFERIGAPLWRDKAVRELLRIGGRRASRGLTATEDRIAALVAAGRSNHEVAAALFVSPRTVEWNLTKIYRKLHVGSRTELAAKLAGRADAPRHVD
jgi:DNA-binding CsgD family transcriptional regulator